jgi:hypothetical protein
VLDTAIGQSNGVSCSRSTESRLKLGAQQIRLERCGAVGHTGRVAHDKNTLAQIHALVAEEKELRAKLRKGDISQSEEHERLRAVETQLDQCWDLLRQRRALRETGGDPRQATVRPGGQVEGYLG